MPSDMNGCEITCVQLKISEGLRKMCHSHTLANTQIEKFCLYIFLLYKSPKAIL